MLLHGAGRSQADWDDVAPLLVPDHRVLAVDLPGHGRSPCRSPWTFENVLHALGDTLDAYGVADAVPVGHSLGGMVAAAHAEAHPGTTPAAVNLDGFWWGRPGRYPGAGRAKEMIRASAGAVAPAEYIGQQGQHAARFGIARERAEAAARGAVRELPDGRLQTLPERPAALEMYDALDALDVFGLLHRVPCPLLVVRARRPQPPVPGMEWFDELLAAYAKGLTEDLALLTDRRQQVRVEDIDATHAMLLEEPGAVAALVRGFVAGVRA